VQRRGGGTIHCCDASSASDGIHARTPRIQQDEPPQLAIKSTPLIALSSMHTANPSSGWPGIGFVSSRPRTLSASSRRAAPSQSDQPSRTKMKIDGCATGTNRLQPRNCRAPHGHDQISHTSPNSGFARHNLIFPTCDNLRQLCYRTLCRRLDLRDLARVVCFRGGVGDVRTQKKTKSECQILTCHVAGSRTHNLENLCTPPPSCAIVLDRPTRQHRRAHLSRVTDSIQIFN